ncbi:MAG: sigma-54-dependent Fis family transcriptional regulator [Bacteroidetes bacterium]|nr:sigma-54-dependent Fis family transcriptional regulator [Bacteroidota bacterium]
MNSKPFQVFIVEDNDWYNKLLVHSVSLNPDIQVTSFSNGTDFLKNLTLRPNVVTLDYRLPDFTGAELLQKVKDFDQNIQVIIISEQGDIEIAVELLHAGAYDYLVKSDDIKQRLLNSIHNIINTRKLEQKIETLQKEVEKKYNFQENIIGNSEGLKNVFALIEKASATNINVSLTGETGTGKELAAKAIHYNSDRKNKNFVPVNLAALPSELIESELFGHEKGAFTGAINKRIGRFEEAHGGTLFLDEIAEMPLAIQAKLLRVLQEKEFTPVGSNKAQKTDCRIIVATHRNMREEVKLGRFREDLFYRVIGLSIELPPLRERGNDILILAKYFIKNFCKENNILEKQLDNLAQKKLLTHGFPGNIRELRSICETATVLANGDIIEASDLIISGENSVADITSEELTLREYDYRIIKAMKVKYDNDLQVVAQKLDISLSTIYRMMKEFESGK